MKKKLSKIISAVMTCLFVLSVFPACGTPGTEIGKGGRVIYPGGEGMDDNKLTIFRWNFSGFNSARKYNTEIYKILK